jgi:type II secretory pathway component GspD/PulD (secretin)
VPETLLAQLGLQSLLTDQNESQEAVTCSDAQFRSYLNAMGQQSGSDILSSPRVTTSFGTQAKVSVQETQMIAGKNQALGPSLGLLPTLNEDGVSLDLDATALYSTAADGNSQ